MLRIFVCCGLFFVLLATGAFASQWEYGESKDALTGKVQQRYLFTRSILPLETTIGLDTYPALGLTCGDDAPYLRSDDIAIDADIDCGEYGCSSRQWVRLKFDEDEPVSLKGDVWEERNGIHLYAGDEDLIARMKKGNTLVFEFKPMLGYKKRLALFSLAGFSDALSRCPKPKPKPKTETPVPNIPQKSVTKGKGDYQLKGGIYGD